MVQTHFRCPSTCTDYMQQLWNVWNVLKISLEECDWVVKSIVFGATCEPHLTLDQILLGLYLLCLPLSVHPPSISHPLVKWSGIPTVLLQWTVWPECTNTLFSVLSHLYVCFNFKHGHMTLNSVKHGSGVVISKPAAHQPQGWEFENMQWPPG